MKTADEIAYMIVKDCKNRDSLVCDIEDAIQPLLDEIERLKAQLAAKTKTIEPWMSEQPSY